jgi:hypothetical protein
MGEHLSELEGYLLDKHHMIKQSARHRVLRLPAYIGPKTRNVPDLGMEIGKKTKGNALYIIREIILRVFNMSGSVNWFYSAARELRNVRMRLPGLMRK